MNGPGLTPRPVFLYGLVMRYFKKFGPHTKVVLPSNRAVLFATVDSLIGFHKTDDPAEAGFYIKCMVEQRYGLSEITGEEYEQEFAEKKRTASPLPGQVFRQERLGSRGLEQGVIGLLGSAAVHAGTALETPTDVRPVDPSVISAPIGIAPALGKRAT